MRNHLIFLLGDEVRSVGGVSPTTTVLEWLRLEAGLAGTKEGCNEGDCGACTVVVARPEGGRLCYRAVNACLQLVGTLDGGQLLTVEHLKAADGGLHPVQEAMVERHGSQCGFCTPGIVMSLFAMAKGGAGEAPVDDVLAGNLCRCTGYAPIARAAEQALASREPDRFDAAEAATVARLEALRDEATLCLRDREAAFYAPASIDALAELLLAHPQATIVAGATDVGLWITKEMRPLATLVWIGRVAELRGLTEADGTIDIGAGVTYAEAAGVLGRHYPDLGELLRRLGSTQIRNVGTIGGNIANGSPIGDASPALMALGATLHLRRGTERRTLPLEDFFIAYGRQDRREGEFVERVTVPMPAPGSRFRAYKVSKRFDQDISAVMGAFALRLEGGRILDARIAFGGMAATPKRAAETERALTGRLLDGAAVADAQAALGRDFAPIGDMRASAAYRRRVARNLIERLRLELTEPGTETRLVGRKELANV